MWEGTIKEAMEKYKCSDKTVRRNVKLKVWGGRPAYPGATKLVVVVPEDGESLGTTGQSTDLPTDLPTEVDELDKEMADMQKEAKLLEGKKKNVEMRLQLEGHITWDEFLKQRGQLDKDRGQLVADKGQLERDRALVDALDNALCGDKQSLNGMLSTMSNWWEDAGACALDIVELVEAIRDESTYDKNNPQAYQSKGGQYGAGAHPAEKTLLIGKALQSRWYDVFKVLVKISRLPEPDFNIQVGRGVEDTGDPEQFDEEQEPEDPEEERGEG